MSSSKGLVQAQVMSESSGNEEDALISEKSLGCGGEECTPKNVIQSALCFFGGTMAGAAAGLGAGVALTKLGIPTIIASTPTNWAVGGGMGGLGLTTFWFCKQNTPIESASDAAAASESNSINYSL